jgi:hypothetical protein
MSTKTLRKRIALVAVAALGAGVLSVAPANATDNSALGSAGPAGAVGTLNIATLQSATGSAVTTITGTTDGSAAESVGLINVGGTTAGTTQTATLLSNGKLVVYTAMDSTYGAVITVSGGTLIGAGSSAISDDRTAISGAAAAGKLFATITPNAGVTSMTVRGYKSTGAGSLLNPTAGSLIGQIFVTVAASDTTGVIKAANSGIYFAADGDGATNNAASTPADTTSSGWGQKVPAGKTNFADIVARDAFGTSYTGASALVTVSATNGGLVAISDHDSTITAATTKSTAFWTGGSGVDGAVIAVAAPSSAPLTTDVTVSVDGVVLGTKTFIFTGSIAKITIASPSRINELTHSVSAASGVKGAGVTFADAAGNTILPVANDTYYPTSGFSTTAASDKSVALSVVPTSSAAGFVDWACGSTAGTHSISAQYLNVDGSIATSNAVSVNCADNAYTYTASYDKASYSPGEIATLTVSFFDSKGNAANDNFDWNDNMTSTSVTAAGGTLVTASSNADTSALGKTTYKVATIVTEGTYQTVVAIPTLKTNNSAQKDVTAGFTLKSQSVGVSNADVLKAIVSLIASINKQIAALQKALLKR